jgi:UDP-glucose 4-epimerase
MHSLITGGAGCIGSELAATLLDRGQRVTVLDNFSSGKHEHIAPLLPNPHFQLVETDLLDTQALPPALTGVETVWHLAANPDIRYTPGDPTHKDLQQNTLATHNLLEAMREAGIARIAFASSSAVYGVQRKLPISEDAACRPISLYGATKLGCEALLSAFSNLFDMEVWVLRFANMVGPKIRKTGGTVIGDFVHRLREDPTQLRILGNGRQAKSYLTTRECVEAIIHVVENAPEQYAVYNVSGNDSATVTRIAELVVEAMGLRGVRFSYTGGEGGWPGDVPRFTFDTARINALGWRAKLSSEASLTEAIQATLKSNA